MADSSEVGGVKKQLNFDSGTPKNDLNITSKKSKDNEANGNDDFPNNRHMEEMKIKYNFDFGNEVPLEGDWEWEIVEPEMYVKRHSTNRPSGN